MEFSKLTRNALRNLDMMIDADPTDLDGDEDESGEDADPQNAPEENADKQDGSADQEEMDMDAEQAPGDTEEEGDTDGQEASLEETEEQEAPIEQGEDAANTPPQNDIPDQFRNMPEYKIFTTKFDEIVGAAELCPPEELAQLRGFARQAIGKPDWRRGAAGQQIATPLDGPAKPHLGV